MNVSLKDVSVTQNRGNTKKQGQMRKRVEVDLTNPGRWPESEAESGKPLKPKAHDDYLGKGKTGPLTDVNERRISPDLERDQGLSLFGNHQRRDQSLARSASAAMCPNAAQFVS